VNFRGTKEGSAQFWAFMAAVNCRLSGTTAMAAVQDAMEDKTATPTTVCTERPSLIAGSMKGCSLRTTTIARLQALLTMSDAVAELEQRGSRFKIEKVRKMMCQQQGRNVKRGRRKALSNASSTACTLCTYR
jgi:hypothetical protein